MRRVPFIVMWVDGVMLNPSIFRKIKSLEFHFPKRKADTGKIVLLDSDHSLVDSGVFRKRQRLSFLCGWKHELEFVGPFLSKSPIPDFPESGESTLTIEFQDNSHKMNKKQKQKKWLGKPENILKQIAESHGLGYNIDRIEGLEFDDDFPLMQANQTDAALLQRLSIRYGYTWGVDGDVLYFRKPADLETRGIQGSSEVPVLSYREGEKTIKSFQPEIKFSRKGKRKNAKKKSGGIDLLSKEGLENFADKMGSMDLGGIAKSLEGSVGNFNLETLATGANSVLTNLTDSAGDLGIMQKLFGGNPFDTDSNQSLDDEMEMDADTKAEVKKADERAKIGYNDVTGTWETIYAKDVHPDEENEETDLGDESGSATAVEEEEARRRNVAAIISASETVKGKLRLSIASMKYRKQQAVVTTGLGLRMSGKYEVTQVDHVLSGSSESFETTLSIMKRKFFPSSLDQKKASDKQDSVVTGTDASPTPGNIDTGKATPQKIERGYDSSKGRWTKIIDGVPEEDASTVTGKLATLEDV